VFAHIPFSLPVQVGNEAKYINQALDKQRLSGDQPFSDRCASLLSTRMGAAKVLMTPSCTHALEMIAFLLNVSPGDEIIMPSFTFSSTANAFALRGAKIVFVDIRPDTMNINEELIVQAISKRTKAIVAVHYAGVACDMKKLAEIARAYKVALVEDAAQGLGATYMGNELGSLADYAAFSFHETKNIQCGEGGALVLKNIRDVLSSEIFREKGTNRSQFFRGDVDKYTWMGLGSSHLLGELPAAYLYAQLEKIDYITQERLRVWQRYKTRLTRLEEIGHVQLPVVPPECTHNGHIFYLKTQDVAQRDNLLRMLKRNGIGATFHYVPLHSSPAGIEFGKFQGKDEVTTNNSSRLVRLPIYLWIESIDVDRICDVIYEFYKEGNRWTEM